MQIHTFEFEYELANGDLRKVSYIPDPERGCWHRREFHRDTADEPWRVRGVESVRTISMYFTPVELPSSMHGP